MSMPVTVRGIDGEMIAVAPFADIALLQLERVPHTAAVATFGNSDLLDAGDQIFTIGAAARSCP